MIMRTPEFARANCRISWGGDLDRALDGADVLYVTMAIGAPAIYRLSAWASMKRGFIDSDQLSVTGAFLALNGGTTILNFARKMEKRCPHAWMLIFANPSAVYSGLVNNHTKIKALGLCGGPENLRRDLTRLMGRDEYCDEYDVISAGVNHCAFLLEGRYRGEDIYEVLGRHLTKGWKPPYIHGTPILRSSVTLALRILARMYHRFRIIIFSCEFDGMAHLFYEEISPVLMKATARMYSPLPPTQLRAWAQAQVERRRKADLAYRANLSRELDTGFWDKNNLFAPYNGHAAIPILKALVGLGRQKITASYPNRGAVAGFKSDAVLEFTQYMDQQGVRPVKPLEIPAPFHGLITNLSTHQTLLGDAIAAQDPRLFADALFAYPIKQNTRDSRELFRELLTIHKDQVPASFHSADDFFR
jgi:6-phospho-beta-glucosidase